MAEPAAAAPPEPAAPAASAPEPTGGQGRLRVVTFNVNGLRACLRRRFATVKGLLEELGAGEGLPAPSTQQQAAQQLFAHPPATACSVPLSTALMARRPPQT